MRNNYVLKPVKASDELPSRSAGTVMSAILLLETSDHGPAKGYYDSKDDMWRVEQGASIKDYASKDINWYKRLELPGATGEFPEGKLNDADEGEIAVAIYSKDGRLVLNFGKKLSFVALKKDQVIIFAEELIKRANQMP